MIQLMNAVSMGYYMVVMATVHDMGCLEAAQPYWEFWDSPMVTGGMTGSVEDGLAFTGMGVVGPFTIT